MKMIKYFFVTLFSFGCFSLFSQSTPLSRIDTATTMVWTGANFSLEWPFGKLAETFKGGFNIGTGFTYKTASNWTVSANFNYHFGSKLRKENLAFYQSLFGDIFNPDLSIVNGDAIATTIYFEGRYWNLGAGIGKIIPVDNWKNSGIWVQANFGFMSHKIFINDPDNYVLQFKGDYKKGYDRRSSGFYMSQFIGYLFMRKTRVASFYAGVEITEMWTKPDRNYIFTLGPTEDMKPEFSALVGIKVGWVVPLFEKKKSVMLYTY